MRNQEGKIALHKQVHRRICVKSITFLIVRRPSYVIFCRFFRLLPPFRLLWFYLKNFFFCSRKWCGGGEEGLGGTCTLCPPPPLVSTALNNMPNLPTSSSLIISLFLSFILSFLSSFSPPPLKCFPSLFSLRTLNCKGYIFKTKNWIFLMRF